ncbi:unnamed protein product [Thlaspi arvense]|uniref:Myb/SANT-like domain-containing protein n=1 Tax=Thlaspi arvense TaxID=13288 RepID=A0AAU9RRU2_THLAR|nr:unnamed protein product [Thlaspi arvense]
MAMANQGQSSNSKEGKIQWTNSMVHIFLEVYETEMEHISWRTGPLKKESKTRIINTFREATGQNSEWNSLKNKYYAIKKSYDIYRRLRRMTGVKVNETTQAIEMYDEWWRDRIQEIPDAVKLRTHPLTNLDILDRLFGNKHISTDDGYYPGSGVDQHTESETVTENESETVNLRDDSDAPSPNLNETPSSHNQISNGCTETLHVLHLQHVNEERRKLRMTS